ncbi:DUF6928 family protein [Gordonia shandongensis]|uniref:DUF6928 family protein n=1 Tax=Gordonia shandongensis TaxID=376351 RepID=UPI00042871B6|nr:hypothetical protein [Gordonia shandongensis]
MFANVALLWFVACPDPAAELRRGVSIDPERTTDFMGRAFPDADVTAIGSSDLATAVDGPDNRVFAAHYGPLAVLAGTSLHTADPHELTAYLRAVDSGHEQLLLSVDPATSTGCFARWQRGELQRGFVGTPTIIQTDFGLPYPFEGPYWAGEHPAPVAVGRDPLSLPFHPADLAEAAHRAWVGFRFTHPELADGALPDPTDPDPTSLPVTVYRVGPDDGRDHLIETSVSLNGAARITEPIAPVGDERPTEQLEPVGGATERPGPISRYFGFRGRL